jgi:peptide/nickel transport system permease protein
VITFIVRRAATGLLVALMVSLAVFALAPLAGEDPSQSGAGAGQVLRLSKEEVDASRRRLGLDRPFFVRYGDWLSNAVQGNLGTSLFRGQKVSDAIADALPVTASIAALALVLTVSIAVPLGVFAAVYPASVVSRGILAATAIGIASPSFAVGLLLVQVVSLELGWLPAVGFKPLGSGLAPWLKSILLPSAALAIPAAAALARFARAAMLEVLQRDYVRTAIGKGLPRSTVIWKHALKNALVPVVTVLGLEIRILLGGSVAVEAVFALPGLGSLALKSILEGDYPMLLGIVMIAVTVVVVVNMLVDMSYALLNPKIRVL